MEMLYHDDFLHWNTHIAHVVFEFWSVNGWFQMFLTCLFVGFFAFIRELSSTSSSSSMNNRQSEQFLLVGTQEEGMAVKIASHCTKIFASYIEMLLIMTFNMFIIVSLLLGHAFALWYRLSYWEMDALLLEENR